MALYLANSGHARDFWALLTTGKPADVSIPAQPAGTIINGELSTGAVAPTPAQIAAPIEGISPQIYAPVVGKPGVINGIAPQLFTPYTSYTPTGG